MLDGLPDGLPRISVFFITGTVSGTLIRKSEGEVDRPMRVYHATRRKRPGTIAGIGLNRCNELEQLYTN
jgi:hypothetical protein